MFLDFTEATEWFDQKTPSFGFTKILPLAKLNANDGGFLVNDELKIVAEVDVLQVTVASDASERSQEAAYYVTGSSDLQKETRVGNETVDVNGFQVSTSQVS